MTFFVCFNLLLRFLVIEIEYYILYSNSNNEIEKVKKALAELDQKILDQNKKNYKFKRLIIEFISFC